MAVSAAHGLPDLIRADSPLLGPRPEQGEAGFRALKRQVGQARLLEKRTGYYIRKLVEGFALLAVSGAILALSDSLLVQVPNAVLMAVAFQQLGMIGHDAGHRQVFAEGRRNKVMGLVLVNLVLGFSHRWWVDKHNRHHNHPNHLDHDPDIDLPVIVFTREQVEGRSPFQRRLIRHQGFLFVPLLFLLAFSLWRDTFVFLRASRRDPTWRRERHVEIALIALHLVLYLGAVFLCLGWSRGMVFVLVHRAFLGLFLGSIFAANHKAMPILAHGVELDFVRRQVLTSRNLRQHPVTDFWNGPLGNQIEHHLFPTMPRCHLRRAEKIVKRHCAEHDIPYHETGTFESYREILRHLHRVGRSLDET